MKKIALILGFLVLSLGAMAQLEVKRDSFSEVSGFVNITDKQTDINDTPYAVVKVRTENINDNERRRLQFDGGANTFLELEYKDGEVWIYITHLASRLRISHPDFGSVSFDIPIEMAPKKGYEMILVNKVKTLSGWGSLTLTTVPEDGATITLNGKVLKTQTPYVNNMIAVGTYEVTVSKERYKTVTKTIEIKNGANNVEIEMPFLGGKISITSQPAGATVIIDDKKYGVTPCDIDIIMGEHNLMVTKEGWITASKKFTMNKGDHIKSEIVMVSCPEGAISHIYSVSPNSKVVFSKGNLQYQASTNTWRFAENQYDIVGEGNNNISPSYTGWIDLFGWGTAYDPTRVSTNDNNYPSFNDWGNNAISNGGNRRDLWKTLGSSIYLLSRRETPSGLRFAKARVNDVDGLIILPDDWRAEIYELQKANDGGANFKANVVSLSDWMNKFEANGAVFLPNAGKRVGNVYYDGYGFYWRAAIPNLVSGYIMKFTDRDMFCEIDDSRKNGNSVRLIHYVNDALIDGTYSNDITERRIRGKVNVTTKPLGAAVYIDDKFRGNTPCVVDEILPGSHELKIVKPLYRIVKKQFVVETDDLLVFNEALEKGVDGAINSVFSVSPTKKVHFSKGNLQYQASTRVWRLAEHQWDVSKDGANEKPTGNGWRDLFGWGTGNNPMNTSDNINDYATFDDWGKNVISNGGNVANYWRTLTRDEWLYIFEKRQTSSGVRYVKAKVNDVCGIVLLPDSWNKKTYKLKNRNNIAAKYNDNTISADDWTNILETNGAVFLPCGLRRCVVRPNNPKKKSWINIVYAEHYWSATPVPNDANYAYSVDLGYGEYVAPREGGYYVRLVCDTE